MYTVFNLDFPMACFNVQPLISELREQKESRLFSPLPDFPGHTGLAVVVPELMCWMACRAGLTILPTIVSVHDLEYLALWASEGGVVMLTDYLLLLYMRDARI